MNEKLDTKGLIIVRINKYDYYAGRSESDCKRKAEEDSGGFSEEECVDDYYRVYRGEELEKIFFTDDLNTSFAMALVKMLKEGTPFPTFFCGTKQ